MLIETSALVAVVFREEGYPDLLLEIAKHSELEISAVSLAEALLVVERRIGAQGVRDLDELLHQIQVRVVAFDADQARLALEAFRQFGKGRHPAGLNFGDCLSYAAAKARGARLLYVGNDFAQTDLA